MRIGFGRSVQVMRKMQQNRSQLLLVTKNSSGANMHRGLRGVA
jgi:hypothetical protein